MAPVTSVSSPHPHSLEGDGPGEEANSTNAPLPAPGVSEEEESTEETVLPLKRFSRMQVLSCIVQIETKNFIECTNKGCLYISLTIWDMAHHLPICEGAKGNDKLCKCRYCPHGTSNVDVLNNHMILSHPYALNMEKTKLKFKDLRHIERAAFLSSPVARAMVRSQWRICYQTKGYIICLTQTCRYVTSLIPEMEEHYIRCSPQIWEDLKFSCQKCPGRTFTRQALDDHIDECHIGDAMVFNTVTPRAKRFWELSLLLYGVTKCINTNCKFIASNKNEAERHWRYCRTPHVENYEVCDYCGGWCDTVDEKNLHIQAVHSRVSSDESIEALKALNHLEMLKNLIALDLSSLSFPWTKVMSYGGETILNRLVEGIEEETVKVPRTKKKINSKSEIKRSLESKEDIPKKEKSDKKKTAFSRRKSIRASDINPEVSLHAVKAEELFNPDRTFLEDLGQAIEVECLETPKVEVQISVGDQSWTVEAPSLETASEVVTRKMPSYTMKSVLAQSIEDSLNLLKIEAKVSSIENITTKPYAPPLALSFSNKPSVMESLKKKFDLIRQREAKSKGEESLITEDSISGAQEAVVAHQEPAEMPKKKSRGKEFKSGVRPWQSLARIKQKRVPEPESEDSANEDKSLDIPVQESNSSVPRSGCKRLLPKKESNEANNHNDESCADKESSVTFKAGKNYKVSTLPITFSDIEYKKLASLSIVDSTKLVRDVAIQHGSSAFPIFSETLLKSRYSRATLLIGYPYSVLKSEPSVEKEDKFTQTATRFYGRSQIFNKKPVAQNEVINEEISQPVLASPRPQGASESQKKLVVLRTLAPVDPMNPAGARILKETRIIGGLKQTVIKNLSPIRANGVLGAPRIIRLVNGPIPRTLNGSSPVTIGLPVRTLVACSAPSVSRGVSGVLTTLATSNRCAVSSASNAKSGHFISYTPLKALAPTVVKTESLEFESNEGSPCSPASIQSIIAVPTASIILPSSKSTAVIVSSEIASATSVVSSNAASASTPSADITSASASHTSSPRGTPDLSPSALNTASSSKSPSELDNVKRPINLRTYFPSSKQRAVFQTAKKPRLDVPNPLKSCSISLPDQNLKPASTTYSKESCTVNLSFSVEQSSHSCCSREDSLPENPYGIFQEDGYGGCQCAIEPKPGTSKGNNNSKKGEFCDSETIIFSSENDNLENCNSLDLSIPFEVFCDSSTAAHGGLYNEKFPWEGKTANIVNDSPEIASQTTLYMEVDEDPVLIPRFKKESGQSQCDAERIVGNSCDKGNVSNSKQVNELGTYLANHHGLQVRNEPMVYVLNKILLDKPNSMDRECNLLSQVNDDERRLQELVHYLTHYNRLLVTHEPKIYIANKLTGDTPSTSKSSENGPQKSVKGRKSLKSKNVDDSETEKLVEAENSVSEKSGDKSVEAPSKKRQRSGVAARAEAASTDPSESEAVVDSTPLKVQKPSGQAPTKKRGRKSKINQEESTLTEDLTKSLASTKLDDANGNEHDDGKPLEKSGKKSRRSVAAEDKMIENQLQRKPKKVEPESRNVSVDVEQPDAENEKSKTSGKKAKKPAVSPTDVLLEMEVEPGDDIVTPARAGRRRKPPPRNSCDSIEMEEVSGNVRPHEPKRRGRPPKAVMADTTRKESMSQIESEEEIFGNIDSIPKPKRRGRPSRTVKADSTLNESTSQIESEDAIFGNEDPPPKPKRRGKPPKGVKADTTRNESTSQIESEEEIFGNDGPPPKPKRRGRPPRAVKANSTLNESASHIESAEEIFGDVGPPSKPKRRGRPPKAVETDWPTSQPEGDDEYIDNDAETDGDLVPAYDRIIFNTTLPYPKKMVTCAICNERMTANEYKSQHIYQHNHICWLKDEEPMDLDDELTLERHLYKVYCHLRTPFICEQCGKVVKSARGFLSHRKFCGKSFQELRKNMVNCSVCWRLMKPSSLSQHLQSHESQSPVKEEPVESKTRAVALRCAEKTTSYAEPTDTVHIDEDEERLAADSQSWIRRLYQEDKRRVSQTLKTLITERIAKEGVARCPNEGCEGSHSDVRHALDHYRTCKRIPLNLKCKVCNYMEMNEYVMIRHVRTLHMEKAFDFIKKIIPGKSGAEESPESGKFLPYLRAAESASISLLFLQPALSWTYKMKKEFLASGYVFPEFPIDEDAIKKFEDYPPSHFELRDKSMCIALKDNRLQQSEWTNLSKLTSFQAAKNVTIMYTGGVVRSLDWFPGEKEQYLIVAIGSIGTDSVNVKSTKSGPGHLQVWSAGLLNNFVNLPELPLNFEFAFCHDFGEVWDLQCCPGGEPDEKRLGLVALATSSGKIAIYAVPLLQSSEPDGTRRATKPEPALVLETGLHESFQVSKVAWSKVKPHRLIAGGFTNGMVAIWDLTATSILLKSGNTILPFKIFHPHFVTITGLSFSPVHEYFIVTSCADKSSKFFNLEDTSVSHVEFNRGLFTDVAWIHHWMSAVAAIDDNSTLGTTTAMIHPLRNFIYQAHPAVTQAESCCLSISVNDWLNALVCGYDSGQVLLTFARKHCHMLDDRKRGHAQLIIPEFHNFNPTSEEIIDCQSYEDTSKNFGIIFNHEFQASPSSKLKPVPLSDLTYFPSTAANKVCWNPNVNSFLTMAIGYHSGFVVLGRLSLNSTELADLSTLMSEILNPSPHGSSSQNV